MKHQTEKIRAGLYKYRGYEIELLEDPDWKDYQGLWRVWDDDGVSRYWLFHFITLRSAKLTVDCELISQAKNK